MASYAALNSLMYILQQIQHHPRPPITIDKKQMESICGNISFLQDFLENYSHREIGDDGKEALETQIADAAYAAEDIIESHIVDQIVTEDGEKSSKTVFYQDLQKVIEDMDFVKKESIKIREKIRGTDDDDQMPRNIISMSANIVGSSTVPPPKRKNANTMVGFDDVLIEIMDRLTEHQTTRQILPIVGMGGIGKTTLARNVYDHEYIINQFDVRIWVTISQEFRLRDILLEALSWRQNYDNKSSEDELGQKLYKRLWERRYLIILDDMWSVEAWEKLMMFFPDNNNGSRIMITTRLSNVSNHFGSCGFKMNLLDKDKSWDLFCKIVFPQDQFCPPELEEIGKKISRNCKGLPLSISVIGGLLAKSEKTQQHWEYIAENLNPIINLEDDKHCLKILYLSYNHLPIHLKPCFLYLGIFPEDKEIGVSCLKKLWVAEGFLKPIAAKSLEVVAEEYLKDLIDRNLILVHVRGSRGKVKYCKIHDLLRDLCLREGEKDRFLWVSKARDFDNLEGTQSQRRIIVHKSTSKEDYDIDRVLEALPSAPLARSLICDFKVVHMLSQSYKLVRVFGTGEYRYLSGAKIYGYSLEEIFKFVNSRYLDFETEWKSTSIFPSSIHLLWNLQTLIIKDGRRNENIHVPPEIWEMSQLRHLEIGPWFSLPDPPNVPLIHEGDDYFILRNLQKLKRVFNFTFIEEAIKRISNIKKLQLYYRNFRTEYGWHNYYLNNLGFLNKLESLSICCSLQTGFLQNISFPDIAFPHSLKKLTLIRTYLHCEDMRMIGSLPHLQVLNLERDSFCGTEWNPVVDEFLCLKFLLIESCSDLVYWNANSTHFPCLEQLHLTSLDNLEEIPLDIGYISTLRSIRIWYCSNAAVMSVKNLFDEQVELGNDDLHVRAVCEKKYSQMETMTTHNFEVKIY